jgi:ribulose-5-phosphate 4-epimerase/fuculose-1-phosphate aldolase
MNEEIILKLKNNIIAIGRLLWEKDLVSGLNGNISVRVADDTILLTGHGTCLGLLQEKDILLMKLNGELLESGQVSTEKLMHTEIYKNLPHVQAIVHTHTTYANAYFLENKILTPRIFEAKFYLGEIKGVDQLTPAVTESGPVIEGLRNSNIAVLRNHGVVAVGKELFDCFLLIQALEEAVKIETLSRLFQQGSVVSKGSVESASIRTPAQKKYKLFSEEQIKEIVNIVNKDAALKELGEKTNMTMDLAVQMNETGQVYSFEFERGRIKNVGKDPNVEFLITAPESVWRSVFNREIDPFVATTQKKMHLKGDFAKISKWYAPCSRVFELWQQVPVE